MAPFSFRRPLVGICHDHDDMTSLDLRPLYHALVRAGTPGSVALLSPSHLAISQAPAPRLAVCYSVVPWPVAPDTPVLYFSATRLPQDDLPGSIVSGDQDSDDDDGFVAIDPSSQPSLLTSLDDILTELIPPLYSSQLTSSLMTAAADDDDPTDLPFVPPLSQGEHPVTSLPCFYLHPCNTADFLRLLAHSLPDSQDPTRILYQWLQSFGRVVSLDIPEYKP